MNIMKNFENKDFPYDVSLSLHQKYTLQQSIIIKYISDEEKAKHHTGNLYFQNSSIFQIFGNVNPKIVIHLHLLK